MNDSKSEEKTFLKELKRKMAALMKVGGLDEDTSSNVERMTILRISTKHINLWIRQLEMKRKEIGELADMIGLDQIKKEVGKEKNLERWAKKCTNHFTKKAKRMLFEEIDNIVWSGNEKEITEWCKENIVFDEITEEEIGEIWNRENKVVKRTSG